MCCGSADSPVAWTPLWQDAQVEAPRNVVVWGTAASAPRNVVHAPVVPHPVEAGVWHTMQSWEVTIWPTGFIFAPLTPVRWQEPQVGDAGAPAGKLPA